MTIFKKYSLFFIGFLMIQTFAIAQKNVVEWYTYEDSLIRIDYPTTWKFVKPIGDVDYQIASPGDQNDKFKENATIAIIEGQMGTTLNEVVTTMLVILKGSLENFKMISNKTITNKYYSNQGTYQKVEYTGRYGKLDLYLINMIWLKNDQAYMIGFGTLKKEKSKFKAIFSSMADSFFIK